jgi:Lrp/AsnC family transcriptional regulator, leucine-responsive regulatory protein
MFSEELTKKEKSYVSEVREVPMQSFAPVVPTNRKLDGTDLRLLAALRANARTTQEELSHILSLSRPAVRERMRRLEALGVLLGYTIVLDWELLGYPILALVNVRTSMGTCDEGKDVVAALSCDGAVVEECYGITGDWCLFAKVRARTSKDLAAFLDAVKKNPRFSATSTTLALGTAG